MSATVDNADVEVPTNHWVLKSEDDVLRFVDTLSSPPGIERLLSLDRLDIKVSRIDSDVAQKLSVMLHTHGPSMVITELRLTQAESFLNSYVDLWGAFAGLTTLKTLYANNVDEGAAEMLMNMKSQLESAELSLDGDNHWAKRTPDQFYIVNPIALLRPSQHTLKKLTAFGAETDVAAEVYSEMRELELEYPGPLRTYELVRAFPGLRTLKISTLGGVFWGTSQKLRATAQQNGDEQSDGTWDDLHCVTAPLSVVYALALRCHVQVLDMIARSPRDTWDLLSDVLKATCPRVLRLRTTCTRILEHGRSLLSGMRVKPRKPCWHMELFVEVLRSDEEEDVRLALVRRLGGHHRVHTADRSRSVPSLAGTHQARDEVRSNVLTHRPYRLRSRGRADCANQSGMQLRGGDVPLRPQPQEGGLGPHHGDPSLEVCRCETSATSVAGRRARRPVLFL